MGDHEKTGLISLCQYCSFNSSGPSPTANLLLMVQKIGGVHGCLLQWDIEKVLAILFRNPPPAVEQG
ncbi:MAG: hypothetical protein KJ990_04710 [Proteobacteria bacterium]|nr:hypothetical protein [Pseudomonadota bacterium]MBU1650001.1 hypothetical protein [Pseudomonadota bacterium]